MGVVAFLTSALLEFPAASAGAEPNVQSASSAGQINTTTSASARLDTEAPPQLKAPFPGCEGVQWNWLTGGKSDIYIHAETAYLNGPMYTDYGLIWINILDRNLNVVGGGQYTVSIRELSKNVPSETRLLCLGFDNFGRQHHHLLWWWQRNTIVTNQEGAAKNEVGWDDLSLRVVQGLSPPENFAAQLWIPVASDVHQLVAAVLFAQRSDETSWRWTACQLKHRADGWQLVARESMESTSPWIALTDRPSINEWGASAGHVRFEQTTAKFVDGKWLFMRHIRATREVQTIEFEGRRRSVPEHGHLVLTWESAKPPVSPGKGWEPNSYTRAFAADGTELIVLRVGW